MTMTDPQVRRDVLDMKQQLHDMRGSSEVPVRVAGALTLKPMATPVNPTGYGVIYIDSADGDLKIKFPTGTIKVIATDP